MRVVTRRKQNFFVELRCGCNFWGVIFVPKVEYELQNIIFNMSIELRTTIAEDTNKSCGQHQNEPYAKAEFLD
jgi:hypothetical protein